MLFQCIDQRVNQALPPKEIVGILRLKSPQSLVRVAWLKRWLQHQHVRFPEGGRRQGSQQRKEGIESLLVAGWARIEQIERSHRRLQRRQHILPTAPCNPEDTDGASSPFGQAQVLLNG